MEFLRDDAKDKLPTLSLKETYLRDYVLLLKNVFFNVKICVKKIRFLQIAAYLSNM